MLRSEFETLTGIYPSRNLYSVIEKFYNESKEDKHEFCRRYMMNADCLAERIQREANKLEQAIGHKFLSKISNLEAELEAEKKRADKLQQELDKELDWHPAEHTGTNMKQEEYKAIAYSCQSHPENVVILSKEIAEYNSDVLKGRLEMDNFWLSFFDYDFYYDLPLIETE